MLQMSNEATDDQHVHHHLNIYIYIYLHTTPIKQSTIMFYIYEIVKLQQINFNFTTFFTIVEGERLWLIYHFQMSPSLTEQHRFSCITITSISTIVRMFVSLDLLLSFHYNKVKKRKKKTYDSRFIAQFIILLTEYIFL